MKLSEEDDERLTELASEIEMPKIEKAVNDLIAANKDLSHNAKLTLSSTWESEYEALIAGTLSYLKCDIGDDELLKSFHNSALNSYTQALVFKLAAEKIKDGLCEPTKVII